MGLLLCLCFLTILRKREREGCQKACPQAAPHCTAKHVRKLHCTALQSMSASCPTLHRKACPQAALHCTTKHVRKLHCTAPQSMSASCIALHWKLLLKFVNSLHRNFLARVVKFYFMISFNVRLTTAGYITLYLKKNGAK